MFFKAKLAIFVVMSEPRQIKRFLCVFRHITLFFSKTFILKNSKTRHENERKLRQCSAVKADVTTVFTELE